MRMEYCLAISIVSLIIINVLSNFTGTVDICVLQFWKCLFFALTSVLGIVTVLTVSRWLCICKSLAYIKNLMQMMGINSLLVMVTHNYFGLPEMFLSLTKHFSDGIAIQCIFEFFLLVAFEFILCELFGMEFKKLFTCIQERLRRDR